jgi:tripeptide aminopeptidase
MKLSNTYMYERLIDIAKLQSYSGEEHIMNEHILDRLSNLGMSVTIQETKYGKNIYATKGVAPIYPCIVAHTDTVHAFIDKKHPEDRLNIFELNGLLYAMSDEAEQVGIGGDDKVGIWACLMLAEQFDNIKIAFFCSEEVGCRGSAEADLKFFSDCSFILQADRRGYGDFVNNIGGAISSKDFQKFVKPIMSRYGYKFCNGGITDVGELSSNDVGISCANISCGYYNPHTKSEVICWEDALNCLLMMYDIVCAGGYVKQYKFIRPLEKHITYYNYGKSYKSGYDDWDWPYYGRYGTGHLVNNKLDKDVPSYDKTSKYTTPTKAESHNAPSTKDYYRTESGIWKRKVEFITSKKASMCNRCCSYHSIKYIKGHQLCTTCDVSWTNTIKGIICPECRGSLFPVDGHDNHCYCTFCQHAIHETNTIKLEKGGDATSLELYPF